MKHASLLVFSDLDGTLLRHEDYDWQAAVPGLNRLREIGAGLVLASSKTGVEIVDFQKQWGVEEWPAIVENGAGFIWPDQVIGSDGADYQKIRQILVQAPKGFTGFGDMSDEDVADCTGLDLQSAHKARQRAFSEPGVWSGTADGLETFSEYLKENGVSARRGGRFLTLSFGRTKADAMSEIVQRLKPKLTIALGDAPNDVEMIEEADWGVVIANSHGPRVPPLQSESQGRILRTEHEGPKGWTEAILSLTANIQ